MATGTKTFTKQEMFDLFLLANKFNNEFNALPFTIADFSDAQADAFVNEYLNVLATQNDDFEPLGRKLTRVANEAASEVIDVVNEPGEVTTATVAKLSFFKTGDKMLIGNNSALGFAKASNGKVELALAARRVQSNAQNTAPTGNVYPIVINPGQDWNVAFSAGLLDSTEGATVSSLYDVSITFFGTEAGLSADPKLTLKLFKVDGGYSWKHADNLYYTEPTDTGLVGVAQDLQRYSFFAPAVSNSPVGTVLLGNFKITLKAVHKKTQEVTEVSIIAKPAVPEVVPPVTP